VLRKPRVGFYIFEVEQQQQQQLAESVLGLYGEEAGVGAFQRFWFVPTRPPARSLILVST
jgi:hypothetical protein